MHGSTVVSYCLNFRLSTAIFRVSEFLQVLRYAVSYRKFKSLGNSGFSLRKEDSYMPFQCMFTQKMMTTGEVKTQGAYPRWYNGTSPSENTGSPDNEQADSELQSSDSPEEQKMCTIMYCVPLISPYSSKSVYSLSCSCNQSSS